MLGLWHSSSLDLREASLYQTRYFFGIVQKGGGGSKAVWNFWKSPFFLWPSSRLLQKVKTADPLRFNIIRVSLLTQGLQARELEVTPWVKSEPLRIIIVPKKHLTKKISLSLHGRDQGALAVLLRACLMFATFCFHHMSLHIQAPKKDTDYEEEDNGMGLCLFDNDLGDLWPLAHLKNINGEIYISKFINFKCCIWMFSSTQKIVF